MKGHPHVAIVIAFVALTVLSGCGDRENVNGKHPDMLAIMGVGAHAGYTVQIDGAYVGQLEPLPELTWIDRLVLRAANVLGILDVDPEIEPPDITMLKVEIQGIEPGEHSVSIHHLEETIRFTAFSYPDGLTDGLLIIAVNEDEFSEEFSGVPPRGDQTASEKP